MPTITLTLTDEEFARLQAARRRFPDGRPYMLFSPPRGHYIQPGDCISVHPAFTDPAPEPVTTTRPDFGRMTSPEDIKAIAGDPGLFYEWCKWCVSRGYTTWADILAGLERVASEAGRRLGKVEDFTPEAASQADDILIEAARAGDRLYFTSPGDRYDHQHFYRVAIRQANAILRAAAGAQPEE